MFSKSAIVAIFAGLAAAQHAPVGQPKGNAITRPLNEIVPACKPFTITWEPTTANQVSLILLRGPSTNVLPLQTIVTGISNSGSYSWTPMASLEADVTHYGLQLIDDVTGQYQYSTQFGISKGPDCNTFVPSSSSTVYGGGVPASTASKAPASSKAEGYPVSSPAPVASTPCPSSAATVYSTTVVTKIASSVPAFGTGYPIANSTIATVVGTAPPAHGTGYPAGNSTGTYTRPSLPESTGAAASLKAGLGLVGAVAAFALML